MKKKNRDPSRIVQPLVAWPVSRERLELEVHLEQFAENKYGAMCRTAPIYNAY